MSFLGRWCLDIDRLDIDQEEKAV